MSMGLDMFLYFLAHCCLVSQIYQLQYTQLTVHSMLQVMEIPVYLLNVGQLMQMFLFCFFYNNQSYKTETTKMGFLKAIK